MFVHSLSTSSPTRPIRKLHNLRTKFWRSHRTKHRSVSHYYQRSSCSSTSSERKSEVKIPIMPNWSWSSRTRQAPSEGETYSSDLSLESRRVLWLITYLALLNYSFHALSPSLNPLPCPTLNNTIGLTTRSITNLQQHVHTCSADHHYVYSNARCDPCKWHPTSSSEICERRQEGVSLHSSTHRNILLWYWSHMGYRNGSQQYTGQESSKW